MLNQAPEENIADSVYDFFTDEDAEQYGLKHSDIEKVEKFVDDNLDFFMQDVYPYNVAISSFGAINYPLLEKISQKP